MSLNIAMMFYGVSKTCSNYWYFWFEPLLHSQYVLKYYFANFALSRPYSV